MDFEFQVGPEGGGQPITAGFASFCDQPGAYQTVDGNQTFVLTWASVSGAQVSNLRLAEATGYLPWATPYNVTNASSGSYATSSPTEFHLFCSTNLMVLALANASLSVRAEVMLFAYYNVEVPILS